jgi:hypothetical protein
VERVMSDIVVPLLVTGRTGLHLLYVPYRLDPKSVTQYLP